MSHLKRLTAIGLTLATAASMSPLTSLAATKDSWVQNSKGQWSYYENGEKVKYDSRYDNADGKYYVLSSKGYRYTKKGLYTSSYIYTEYGDKVKFKQSYYIQSDGSLLTSSWKKLSGKWYYFNYCGKMEKGTVRDKFDEKSGDYKSYLLGSDGARITKKGWHKIKVKDVYSDIGTVTRSSYFYVLSDGTALCNCVKKIGGKYYAFEYNGTMVANRGYRVNSNSKTYLYGSSGARVKITKKGWVSMTITYSSKSTYYSAKDKYKAWYYANKDGSIVTGWKKISGKWYYFSDYSGTMYSSCRSSFRQEDGTYRTYIFNSKGVCVNH